MAGWRGETAETAVVQTNNPHCPPAFHGREKCRPPDQYTRPACALFSSGSIVHASPIAPRMRQHLRNWRNINFANFDPASNVHNGTNSLKKFRHGLVRKTAYRASPQVTSLPALPQKSVEKTRCKASLGSAIVAAVYHERTVQCLGIW